MAAPLQDSSTQVSIVQQNRDALRRAIGVAIRRSKASCHVDELEGETCIGVIRQFNKATLHHDDPGEVVAKFNDPGFLFVVAYRQALRAIRQEAGVLSRFTPANELSHLSDRAPLHEEHASTAKENIRLFIVSDFDGLRRLVMFDWLEGIKVKPSALRLSIEPETVKKYRREGLRKLYEESDSWSPFH